MDETNGSVLINDVHSTIEPQSLKTKPKYFTFHTFGMQVFYKKNCVGWPLTLEVDFNLLKTKSFN